MTLLACCCDARGCSEPVPTSRSVASVEVPPVLWIPYRTGEIRIDGELTEVDWSRALRTAPFRDQWTKREAVPYSEARLLWDHEYLYLGLDAEDEDIEARATVPGSTEKADDAFDISFHVGHPHSGYTTMHVNALGTVTEQRARGQKARGAPWSSGAQVAAQALGTINDRSDRDRWWTVEARIPLAQVGLLEPRPFDDGYRTDTLSLSIKRCDFGIRGEDRCGVWSSYALRLERPDGQQQR